MRAFQLIIAILLLPLSIWYAAGVAVRNGLYRMGLKKSVRPQVPTIGIGNLRMGGTGKTPHTEYLIRLLQGEKSKIALLSRGYGRKTRGFVLADSHSDATTLGDEPAMIASKFPDLTVAVCEDRVAGVERLMQLPQPPGLVLLDDVYQHRHIKPSLLILLTEYGDPFFNDAILPFGNLREFRSGRRRADIVVVTKCPPLLSESRQNEYRKKLRLDPHQSLFFSQIAYQEPQPLYNDNAWQPVKEVLLVTGIAHPDPLKHYLETRYTVTHLHYPDHHDFGDADCHHIAATFHTLKEPSKAVVTTEKDAIRLLSSSIKEILQELPIFYIPIQVSFLEGDTFDKAIKKII